MHNLNFVKRGPEKTSKISADIFACLLWYLCSSCKNLTIIVYY